MVKSDAVLYLRGDLYNNTHKASVFSILGKNSPTIVSKNKELATKNYNIGKELLGLLYTMLDPNDLAQTSSSINRSLNNSKTIFNRRNKPCIIIPNTPNKLPVNIANSLIGAIYHECWNLLYGFKEVPTIVEIQKFLEFLVTIDEDWVKYQDVLCNLYQIIDNIRCIKNGLSQFPNTHHKISELWELTVSLDPLPTDNKTPIQKMMGILRDLWTGDPLKSTYNYRMEIYTNEYKHLLSIINSEYVREIIDILTQSNDPFDSLYTTFKLYDELSIWFTNKVYQKPEDTEDTPPDSEVEEPLPEDKDKSEEVKPPEDKEGDSENTVKNESEIEGDKTEEELENNKVGKDTDIDQKTIELDEESTQEALEHGVINLFDIQGLLEVCEIGDEITTQRGESKWEKTIPINYVKVNETGDTLNSKLVSSCWVETKGLCNFLINRLKRRLLSEAMPSYREGVFKGTSLSDSYLIDTKIELITDIRPSRPYREVIYSDTMSTAAVILVDMSASMREHMGWLIQTTLLLSWFLDSVGAKYAVIGFRNGRNQSDDFDPNVTFFEFKDWYQKFKTMKINLSFLVDRLNSGTPTSDALKLAIDNLDSRSEKRKILLCITDGKPNTEEHLRQTKYLCRLSAKMNIVTVGVGIGEQSRFIKKVFKLHAWSEDIKNINKELFKLFDSILKVK